MMFRPGFRVATATDLASATEWLEATNPSLVVFDPELASPSELTEWWEANQLDDRTTISLGDSPDELQLASAIVHSPVTLPSFMRAVRSVVGGEPAGLLAHQTQGALEA